MATSALYDLHERLNASIIDLVGDANFQDTEVAETSFVEAFMKCFDVVTLAQNFGDQGVGGIAETDNVIFTLVLSRFTSYLNRSSERLKGIAAAFESAWESTRNSHPNEKLPGLGSILHAYSLLRLSQHAIVENRAKFFEILAQVKVICAGIQQRETSSMPAYWQSLAMWANGLAHLFQAQKIDVDHKDAQAVKALVAAKAKSSLEAAKDAYAKIQASTPGAIALRSSTDPMLQFSSFYIACAASLLANKSDVIYWLTKAKAEGLLPDVHVLRLSTELERAVTPAFLELLHSQTSDDAATIANSMKGAPMGEMKPQAPPGSPPSSPQPVDIGGLGSSLLTQSTLNFLIGTKDTGSLGVSVNLNNQHAAQFSSEDILLQAKERLRERLSLYQMQEQPIPGDGNCQFASLSDQLFGTVHYADAIRANVVGWLRRNGDLELPNGAKMREFVHTGTWDEYCVQMVRPMATNGTWGDHLTLVAASELFGRAITIISSVNDSNFMSEIAPRAIRNTKPIFLSHYAEFHYTSIKPL